MMNRHNPRGVRSRRRGMVLLYVMFGMIVFALFASLAVDVGHARVTKVQLQFAADAAARAACQDLPNGVQAARNTAVSMAAQDFADGNSVAINSSQDVVFGVWNPLTKTFTPQSGYAQANSNAVQVIAQRTAARGNAVSMSFAKMFGNNSCDVRATSTACLTGNAGNYSIIGMNGITMSVNAYTDSYNATNGAYASASARHKGAIASNGNIVLSNSVKVDGDSRCGAGRSTTLLNSASVTGLNAPLGSVLSYPSVTMPSSYTDLGDVNMSSGTASLPGGTYLLHNLVLSGTAHFTWTGPVNLYIMNSYAISGSAQIDTYQNLPNNRTLFFLPSCTTATWTGTNICVGELYAPDTDFTIGGSVELFGRVVARTINNTSSGGMHYDESMSPPGATAARSAVSMVQ
ncbi:MAG TPA: pilus assembly protein TadG-related protein [Tepidisphaeraceae bacterium]|nr:pilus assembly protein TadG-related protein [Tepidisphaeraceae bacterium]